MPENPPVKTYKHQVPADVYLETCFTPRREYEQFKDLPNYGIRRMLGKNIRNDVNLKKYIFSLFLMDDSTYTLIENTNIFAKQNGWLTLSNIDGLLDNIIFINCKLPHIAFHNLQLGNKDRNNDIELLTNFYFADCEIGSFSFQRSILGGIYLEKTELENIEISNCKIGSITINGSLSKEINIRNSEIESIGTLNNSVFDRINISKQSKIGNMGLDGAAFIEVTINDSSTKDILAINNPLAGNFWFQNNVTSSFRASNLCCRLSFNQSIISNVRLEDCNFSVLQILGSCKMDMFFAGGSIDLVDFSHIMLSKDNNISFFNISFYAILMEEFSAFGLLFFRRVIASKTPFGNINKIFNIKDDFFYNEKIKSKAVELLQVKKDNYIGEQNKLHTEGITHPTFRISQSSLGKTEFTECDLVAFNFEYNNSKIIEIFINGGTVPTVVEIYDDKNNFDDIEKIRQQKTFFEQLKKVFEVKGNIVRATRYHAKAAELHMQVLRARRGRTPEWWIYYFNKISNKHSESWIQALKFILAVSLPIYIFYWFCTGLVSVYGEWSLTLLGDSVGYYFSFLLPTHRIDFIKEADLNLGTMAFDFIGRILIGYGIYQLISAFRKHGKKG